MKRRMVRPAVAVATISLALPLTVALHVMASPAAAGVEPAAPKPSKLALASIPRAYLSWYQRAAKTCPGLPWPVLAGIGMVESGHGRSTAPGVHTAASFAGAEGPMQFEPETFAAYAVKADPHRQLSLYNPEDAIFTAARMLCADGAGKGTHQGLRSALLAYDHVGWYPVAVLSWAARYTSAALAKVAAHPAAPDFPERVGGSRPTPRHPEPSGVAASPSSSARPKAPTSPSPLPPQHPLPAMRQPRVPVRQPPGPPAQASRSMGQVMQRGPPRPRPSSPPGTVITSMPLSRR